MSEITRYRVKGTILPDVFMESNANGSYVLWHHHNREVERLKAENEQLKSGIAALQGGTTWLEAEKERTHTDRRAAEARLAEVERLRQEERETADHQRTSMRDTIDRLGMGCDFARRETERLKAEVSRLSACRDELRDVTEAMDDPAINNTVSLVEAVRALKAERDKAQGEVKRLTDAGNHSASLNSSRPSDEDI